MRILMIASYLPYPLDSGGHIRLFQLLKRLSKKHTITLLCEKRSYQTDDDIQQVEKICRRVITVDRKKQWTLSNIISAGFSSHSFLTTGHTHDVLRKKIQEELDRSKYDLIHIETFYVMRNLPKTKLPIVLVEHNIEYLVYKRYAQRAPVILRPFLLWDVKKLQLEEERVWRETANLVAVSEEEAKLMGREVAIVPNGVDLDYYRKKSPSRSEEKTILFMGNFSWIQNRDIAMWIITGVWPILKKQFVDRGLTVKLWIVGRSIPQSIMNLTNDQDIVFDENAPSDTRQIFEKSDVLLSPIRIGGGTSYKILESMASGVPVVTTPLGADGLKINKENILLIAKTEDSLADATIKLLYDNAFYQEIADAGRKHVQDYFNWDDIVKQLERVYQNAVSSNI